MGNPAEIQEAARIMSKELKIALVGLDTSHSIEFARRMQAPDCPKEQKVEGMRAVSCLRFDTPFQSKEGLDGRQRQLEDWGVKVTLSFDEAVADCDAVMLEINDPAFHLEYFKRCATLGKRLFIDKPLADTAANGREIRRIAKERGLQVMSCSPLRYLPSLAKAMKAIPSPTHCSFFGPIGKAPAGSSIVWYGVHTCEMLQAVMGNGALSSMVVQDKSGPLILVEYPEERRAVIDMVHGFYYYGGSLRDKRQGTAFAEDGDMLYPLLLKEADKFFRTGKTDATIDAAYEVLAIIHAAERSLQSGKKETVEN